MENVTEGRAPGASAVPHLTLILGAGGAPADAIDASAYLDHLRLTPGGAW